MTDYMLYEYNLSGLSFTVKIYQDTSGAFQAEFHVTEGHMDVNALWFSDGDAVKEGNTTLTKSDSSLNMNGSTLDGGSVVWDDYEKLSSAGLGTAGTNKATYLDAGETATFQIHDVPTGATLDYFSVLGIRSTSTSTPEGSIKAVDSGHLVHVDPPRDNFDEWGTGPDNPGISHVTLYWRASDVDITPNDVDGNTGAHGMNDPDGFYTVKFSYDDPTSMIGGQLLSQDLDNNIDAFLDFLVAQGRISVGDKDQLMGVNISGGQNNDSNDLPGDGKWYDYHLTNTDPAPDPVPVDLINALNAIGDPYPIANKEIDVAYAWNGDTHEWVATV